MRDTDEPFVLDSWRKSWRLSAEGKRGSPAAYHALFEDLVLRGVWLDDATRVLVVAVEADLNEIAGWVCYAPGSIPTIHYAIVRKRTLSGGAPLRRAGLFGAMIHLVGVRDRLVYTFRPAEHAHGRDHRYLGVERALLDAAKRRGIVASYESVLGYLGRSRGR